jgi:hypothetical protein
MQMDPLEQQCHISLRKILLILSMVKVRVLNLPCMKADTWRKCRFLNVSNSRDDWPDLVDMSRRINAAFQMDVNILVNMLVFQGAEPKLAC